MRLIDPAAIVDDGRFTRASTATYFNSDGVMATAAIDEPRMNYPPTLLAPLPTTGGWRTGLSLMMPSGPPTGSVEVIEGLPFEFLAEPAATNLMLNSQNISGWTAVAATFTADSVVAPDGSQTADLLVPDDTSVILHGARRMASTTVASGAAVGASIFLKERGYAAALFRVAPTGEAAGFEMRVDLGAGTITSSGAFGTGASLTEARLYGLPGGWYRLEIEGSIVGVTTYGLHLYVGDGDAYAGDETAAVAAWGWQLEVGSVSSYIPTSSSAVTRAADVGDPMLVSGLPEVEPIWDIGATYALNQTVRGPGALKHRLFISLVAGNIGNQVTNTAKWLDIGATNRWRLHDSAVSSKATSPETLDFIASTPVLVDTMVLMGLSAGEVRAVQIDESDGIVFDETFSLVDDSEITNSYAYCFNDIKRKTELVISDLRPYAGAQIAIRISDVDATVMAGECVIGRAIEIGDAQHGARVGIQDYSRKVRDDFGNYAFVERAFSRTASFSVVVEDSFVDVLVNLLASFRAKPIVYIGADEYASTIVFGITKDFSVVIQDPNSASLCALELESLI